MFYHINGVVTDIEPNLAVLECGGVGYALNVSLNTLASVKIGERAKLYIYECIRPCTGECHQHLQSVLCLSAYDHHRRQRLEL